MWPQKRVFLIRKHIQVLLESFRVQGQDRSVRGAWKVESRVGVCRA